MKLPIHFFRRRIILWGMLLSGLLHGALFCAAGDEPAETAPVFFPLGKALPGLPGFSADLLWTGSAETGASLINRGDLRLHGLGFTARTQVVDKRPLLFWEQPDEGITALGGGLYHDATGSRLLYGIIDETGLSARLRNPWGRGVPYVETHKASGGDLKTEPVSTKEPAAYLYLGSPRLGSPRFREGWFRGFAAVLLENDLNGVFTGGLDLGFTKKTSLRIEGLYTGKELAPRQPAAWFSESPPLPERPFRNFGLGMVLTTPIVNIAADASYSETFAYGRDLYGNLALRFGNRPWQLSLAADAAGNRYVDRAGSAVGAGFRTAAKFEWRGKGSRLFRASASLRSGGIGQVFSRSSSSLYYHFSAAPRDAWVSLSRLSLTVNRNAQDPAKIRDNAALVMGFNLGPVRSTLTGTLNFLGSAPEGHVPIPYPDGTGDFNSVKIAAQGVYFYRILELTATLGCTIPVTAGPVWETGLSLSIRGSPGRLTLKISSPEFPARWTGALSWRLNSGWAE